MKVLCFTNSSYKFNKTNNKYHGAGWIDSLLMLLENHDSIELGISFFHNKVSSKVTLNNLTYYPIYKESRKKNPIKTIIGDWRGEIEDKDISKKFLEVIEDYEPDIIQVFGTEGVFASIQRYTKIPVLVHLQGLLNPYYNTYYPINQSKWNFLLNPIYLIPNILGKGPSFAAKRFNKMSIREAEHFKHLKFVSGRTDWDYFVTKISNPNIKYFQINEILRPIFYEQLKSDYTNKDCNMLKIVSTISPTIYKGIDVILKTAKLLKEQTNVKFSWKIIGVDSTHKFVRHFENNLKINHQKVNVDFLGIKKSEAFINQLKQSDLFIHPSYIDNSPNSVCEAQILGLPVIACNVGGLSSLIQHDNTGVLVPSNGVYEIVNEIQIFNYYPDKMKKIGLNARRAALLRHDKQKILSDLLSAYDKIINIE